ncbi:protein associated with topo II related - 1 [Glossina fuscipes fuscipes]
MEDSFFGFDTSLPLDDDGGGGQIAEPSEEEYDALNDETFGCATNGDWEEAHENLVRLDECIDVGKDQDTFSSKNNQSIDHVSTEQTIKSYKKPRQQPANFMTDSDLELNLASMKLDDVDISYENDEIVGGCVVETVKMDPSVWSAQPVPKNERIVCSSLDQINSNDSRNGMPVNPTDFLRQHFPSPFQQQFLQFPLQGQQPQNDSVVQVDEIHNTTKPPKICTLEDIERNLIMQQAVLKRQHQSYNSHDIVVKQKNSVDDTVSNTLKAHHQHLHQHHQQTPPQAQYTSKVPPMLPPQQQLKGPPGLGQPVQQPPPRPSSNFNNLGQHPINNLLQQQQPPHHHQQAVAHLNASGNRLPPGLPIYPPGVGPHLSQPGHTQLPPHPLLNQHGLPNAFPHPQQRSLPNPHLPIALNNFAMHPNFNAIRAAGIHPASLLTSQQQTGRIMGHPPPNPIPMLNNQAGQTNSNYNMFNMRLVQEIQQNHPLLQNAARQVQQHQFQQQNHLVGNNSGSHQHALARGNVGGNQKLNHNTRREGMTAGANGNLPPEEFDEYANLMSTRDKHWLIGIQLSQLNPDTPYIDDYYYTVYKERKTAQNGNVRLSQAHKDNQLNHPLTQPKGHAQLILVQLGNKNGTRNGQHQERRNSDNHHGINSNNVQELKLPTYLFTPLKFENSLGKLQYGSVTAPRKIIDAEVMSSETSAAATVTTLTTTGNEQNSSYAQTQLKAIIGGQTKVDSPGLIQTSLSGGDLTTVNSQCKSRYILLHIESLYRVLLKLDDLNNPNAIATILTKKKKESERIAALEQLEAANKTEEERSADASSNPSLKCKFNYEIETKEALVEKLLSGLQHDKIVAIMNIRKGKVLIRRIMPYIENDDQRWNVWIGVFNSLQNVFKKDRDDTDGILYSLYPEFKKQIKLANFEIIVRVSSAITLNDKKSNGIFCSKFGISSLVCLILQAENIYVQNDDVSLTNEHKESWRHFLDQVASSLNRTIQSQTICAAIESDSIQPVMDHFARFKDLKLDSLLALITEAKQQIN